MNESFVLQAVQDYVTGDGLTLADFDLRVVDANFTFFLPSIIQPWAPPDLFAGDCMNIMSFYAYFVGDNSTTIKRVRELFDSPKASE